MLLMRNEPVLLRAGFIELKATLAFGTVTRDGNGLRVLATVRISRKRMTRPFRDNLDYVLKHSPALRLKIQDIYYVIPVTVSSTAVHMGTTNVVELELNGTVESASCTAKRKTAE